MLFIRSFIYVLIKKRKNNCSAVYAQLYFACGLYRIENGFPHFVVITRPASAETAFIHDRMPLMLPESLLKEWINPKTAPSRLVSEAVTDVVFEKAQ